MENAGRGAAEIIHRIAPESALLVLCGSGNNGGDGYVIARHLELAGQKVEIISLVDPESLRGDALINAKIASKSGLPIHIATTESELRACIGNPDGIVDCLLGTGAKGSLREPYASAVAVANQMESLRIAIDIPTGLDCDTGDASEPTFRADHTITFVAAKVGFEKRNASEYTGVVHEVGIGVPRQLLRDLLKQ